MSAWSRLSLFSKVSLVGVILLLLGVGVAVRLSVTQQEVRSRASGSGLANGSFENTGSSWLYPWDFELAGNGQGSISQDSSVKEDGNYSARIDVPQAASENWYVQLGQPLSFSAGTTYYLTFWAKANVSRTIGLTIQKNYGDYGSYIDQDFNITTSWQQYTLPFTSPVSESNGWVALNVSQAAGTVWFDNVQFSNTLLNPTSTPTPVPSGSNPITFDSKNSVQVGGTSQFSWNHTTTTQNNRILLVGVSLHSYSRSVSSVTYNGASFTKVGSANCPDNYCRSGLWYLVAPASGTHPIAVTLNGSTDVVGGSVSYYNVSQTSPIGTAVTGGDWTSSATLNLSGTNTGQIVVDSFSGGGTNSFSPGSGQTQQWYDFTQQQGSGSTKSAGANGTTMTWSANSADDWSDIAAPVNPAPSAVPTPTVVYYPTATPTVIPTNTPYPPTPTVVYYPTVTPTVVATNTPYPPTSTPPYVPTNTPVPPTSTPYPTVTPVAGNTYIALDLLLHGIGKGGDTVNPTGTGNMNPNHPQRNVDVQIFNNQNVMVFDTQGVVNYDAVSGSFKGAVDLGSTWQTGAYLVKVKGDQYLRAQIGGIQTITSGQSNTMSQLALVTGDINGDNQINILDYNILMGCYSDLLPAVSCNAGDKLLADLTDDGAVNQFDYNLFLRELLNKAGQ